MEVLGKFVEAAGEDYWISTAHVLQGGSGPFFGGLTVATKRRSRRPKWQGNLDQPFGGLADVGDSQADKLGLFWGVALKLILPVASRPRVGSGWLRGAHGGE